MAQVKEIKKSRKQWKADYEALHREHKIRVESLEIKIDELKTSVAHLVKEVNRKTEIIKNKERNIEILHSDLQDERIKVNELNGLVMRRKKEKVTPKKFSRGRCYAFEGGAFAVLCTADSEHTHVFEGTCVWANVKHKIGEHHKGWTKNKFTLVW